jgi:hypothetical protein
LLDTVVCPRFAGVLEAIEVLDEFVSFGEFNTATHVQPTPNNHI